MLFAYFNRTGEALVYLYFMFVFWGSNKVFTYFQGDEIRLTYVLKIPANSPKVIRVIALLFSVLIAMYGVVELWKLII